ncbi:c-Myc-binding protein-like [Halyomorpha halys]|uniref:c-Myc-binding protein-like n=1 Tax=Halyomorpha halys TaxID=286706 RepID=UPI0006D4F5B0|nr:c-Myc-binding protein-like [Halyomorpha halys]
MDDFVEDLNELIETIYTKPSKSFKEREKKKGEFKEYLYRSGVNESLSRALKMLFDQPTKPKDPLDFICSNIGQPRISRAEFKKMSEELHEMNKMINKLEDELINIRNPPPITDEESITTTSEKFVQ